MPKDRQLGIPNCEHLLRKALIDGSAEHRLGKFGPIARRWRGNRLYNGNIRGVQDGKDSDLPHALRHLLVADL